MGVVDTNHTIQVEGGPRYRVNNVLPTNFRHSDVLWQVLLCGHNLKSSAKSQSSFKSLGRGKGTHHSRCCKGLHLSPVIKACILRLQLPDVPFRIFGAKEQDGFRNGENPYLEYGTNWNASPRKMASKLVPYGQILTFKWS